MRQCASRLTLISSVIDHGRQRFSVLALPAVGTTALLWKFKKLREPVIVMAAAAIGSALYPLMHK